MDDRGAPTSSDQTARTTGLVPPPFDARRYDVLDASARPQGSLTLRRPGRVVGATRDAVWVVETDADDVPTLLRYPIVREKDEQ